ncbi:hypothetical protein Leryth_023742 [Lithospermum erythrorhizon]|nr:hypothetical protein Leryth_023742 [Lithospermum erythrorhizon]
MGKGLIPADGELWRIRRHGVQKLEAAAANGEDVEMESLFSRLTLDIIGKAWFSNNLILSNME